MSREVSRIRITEMVMFHEHVSSYRYSYDPDKYHETNLFLIHALSIARPQAGYALGSSTTVAKTAKCVAR